MLSPNQAHTYTERKLTLLCQQNPTWQLWERVGGGSQSFCMVGSHAVWEANPQHVTQMDEKHTTNQKSDKKLWGCNKYCNDVLESGEGGCVSCMSAADGAWQDSAGKTDSWSDSRNLSASWQRERTPGGNVSSSSLPSPPWFINRSLITMSGHYLPLPPGRWKRELEHDCLLLEGCVNSIDDPVLPVESLKPWMRTPGLKKMYLMELCKINPLMPIVTNMRQATKMT